MNSIWQTLVGALLVLVGVTIAITQTIQYYWNQQQAEIAQRNRFVHHAVGSPKLAAIGIILFIVGVLFTVQSFKEAVESDAKS